MGRVEKILEFWFGRGDQPERQRMWFNADPGFDQACSAGFRADYERAASGELDGWMNGPSGALALVLLLDQFPRNMFRDTARAFATDYKALAVAKHTVAAKLDQALAPSRRAFVYMPFEHSENLGDQHESIRLFRDLAEENPASADYLKYAERHLEVITRFGRFPHRNAVLKRPSTPDESEFLSSGGARF